VHALRHVHRLVVPGGTLVDMHPVTEEQIETRHGVVGVIREPAWIDIELPNAEAGLRSTIDEGLFELEAETAYDVLQHFDRPDELIEAKSEILEGQDTLIGDIREAPPPLATRMHVVFRRLRVLAPWSAAFHLQR
jgi:hypothetical protein